MPPLGAPREPLLLAVIKDEWYNDGVYGDTGKKLQDKLDCTESMMRKSKGINGYVFDLEGFYEALKSKLPEKFKKPYLEKFKGTENPKSHVKMYVTALKPMGLENEHMVQLFLQYLSRGALPWFLALESSKTCSWDDVVNAFIK